MPTSTISTSQQSTSLRQWSMLMVGVNHADTEEFTVSRKNTLLLLITKIAKPKQYQDGDDDGCFRCFFTPRDHHPPQYKMIIGQIKDLILLVKIVRLNANSDVVVILKTQL